MIPALDAIKARAEAATPGPWDAVPEIDGMYAERLTLVRPLYDVFAKRVVSIGQTRQHNGADADADAEKNIEFIAHARTDIPLLIAEVERLRAIESKVINGICECEGCPR